MPNPTHSHKARLRSKLIALAIMLCAIVGNTSAQVVIQPGTIYPSSSGRGTGTHTSSSNPTANNSPFPNSTNQTDTSATKGLVYAKETPDSVLRMKVFMFRYQPTEVKINRLWNPTLDPTGAQFADPLDALNGTYYLSKGLIGQPHINIVPQFGLTLTQQMQPDLYPGYAKHRDNIWLYQTFTPYSRLGYGSSLIKDYQVQVAHSQNILPGWNIAFDYRLYAPEGNYAQSGDKNHYLDLTTNYFSSDSRLQAAAGLIWQSFDIEENGGLSDDRYFTEQLQTNRAGIPVVYTNAGSRQHDIEAFARISYNLVRQIETYRQRDSIAPRTSNDTLPLLDTLTLIDTIPTRQPRILNPGVIGLDLDYNRQKRLFIDSTLWRQATATLFWTSDAYPDYRWHNPIKLTLGLQPRILQAIALNDTLQPHTSLNPFATLRIALGRTQLTAHAQWQTSLLSTDSTDHLYRASLLIPLDSTGHHQLNLHASHTTLSPYARLILDSRTHPTQPLRQQTIASLTASYSYNDLLQIDLHTHHLSHNLWYDSLLTPQQGNSPLLLLQAQITARLRLHWLCLDLQQNLQLTTDPDQLPLPLWTSKNSLYANLHLFNRALHLQLGTDIRYLTPFNAPGYDPATGLFFHQNQTSIGNYLWADLFINIQVKRASIYLKAGHLNALWETHPNYFLLPHYPGQKLGLCWGINWHFFD